MEYSEIINMRKTSEFIEIQEKIREKDKELRELFEQLNSKFPIGPDRTWCLTLSGDVHSMMISSSEDDF